MSLVQRNRLEIKLGEYAVGQTTALTDPLLVGRAQDYRRRTASRMASLDPDDIFKRLPESEYHVSLKVDGEFDLLVYVDGEAILVNPGGTVRVGLPLLSEAIAQLKKAGVKKAIIPGEFFYTRAEGKRARVHDVTRVSRQPASQAELDNLSFAPFDIDEIDGKSYLDLPFAETWKRLTGIFGAGKLCRTVETVHADNPGSVQSRFRNWVDQGAEGIVIRSDVVGLFKMKPRQTLDAAVIGFTEGADDRKGMIHDLLVALMRADGCLHVLGHVGGGFSEGDRRGFLSDLKDMRAESDYVEVNEQVRYQMVRPEWVIEISVLDLIVQSTRGLPINKMALNWNAAALKYEIVRRLPLVGLISPQFVRRRDDKSINATDLRMQQVTDLVEVPLVDRDARRLHLPKSDVLRREVYTKQMKGQTMVRKLLMWQTNKQKESDEYPAYVIHFTDYSPNRKTPLEREVRVSSSREQIDQLWSELAAEAFLKGWAPAGSAQVAKEPKPESSTAVTQAEPPAKKRSPRKKKSEE